mgnify:CR=1 FL=1|tara:strand:- start:43 stop:822 length:780 start_codon:yes stop_codon:yes gene_type:complete
MNDVYVQFDPAGRMGNRMFQYAFGWLLAKQRNCKLFHEGLPNFNIPPNLQSLYSTKGITRTRHIGDQKVNFNELVKDENAIIVDSYLQRAEYYINHRDKLRELFSIKDNNEWHINKGKLIVHVRETDYHQVNCFLGYDYYSKLIKDSGFKDIGIITDNSYCETVQKLLSDGCEIISDGLVDKFELFSNQRSMNDWMVLLLSENIALSQSSFSWWAAFLGYHKKVIFPYSHNINMWPVDTSGDVQDVFFDFDNTNVKYIL